MQRSILIKFLFLILALCWHKTALAQSPFLEARADKLFLANQEFKSIGFNTYDLLYQYTDQRGSKETARRSLKDLSSHGYKLLRVIGSPYFPSQFQESFFDNNPVKQDEKRAQFFTGYDEMMADCESYGFIVTLDLVWDIENLADLGHHSLHEGITNPDAAGYKMLEEYILTVVKRYKNRPGIIWEIGNEWNLFADLQSPGGVFMGEPEGDSLHPGPLIRDDRNNFNSQELTDLLGRLYYKIKSIDPHHLIASGASESRRSAMHLLRAAISGKIVDWTYDSPMELEDYIRLTNRDMDVISIHYYGGENDQNLEWYMGVASRMGKPLYVGESGIDGSILEPDYSSSDGLNFLNKILKEIVAAKVPATCIWAYVEDQGPFQLYYGVTDLALEQIEEANKLF